MYENIQQNIEKTIVSNAAPKEYEQLTVLNPMNSFNRWQFTHEFCDRR